MNTATEAVLRDLLARWLASPERDLEAALVWCRQYLATRPYSLIDTANEQIAYQVGGAYRRAHREQLARWTNALSGWS